MHWAKDPQKRKLLSANKENPALFAYGDFQKVLQVLLFQGDVCDRYQVQSCTIYSLKHLNVTAILCKKYIHYVRPAVCTLSLTTLPGSVEVILSKPFERTPVKAIFKKNLFSSGCTWSLFTCQSHNTVIPCWWECCRNAIQVWGSWYLGRSSVNTKNRTKNPTQFNLLQIYEKIIQLAACIQTKGANVRIKTPSIST